MKILLIGEKGQLAWELIRTLMPIGEVVSVDYPTFDISNKNQVYDTVKTVSPDLVINASAYTDVDGAEKKRELAMAVNADGPGWLAKSCRRYDIPLIHFSTDFVFDGTKRTPYVETDEPNPINYYGLTKLKGEEAAFSESNSLLVFRLAWLYSARGNNFVSKFLQWAKTQEVVRVVNDQVGNPTWARFVAESIVVLLTQALGSGMRLTDWCKAQQGVYHLTSAGSASRYEWAQKIWELAPDRAAFKLCELLPAKSSDFKTAAERPAYSVLGNRKLEIILTDWISQQESMLLR